MTNLESTSDERVLLDTITSLSQKVAAWESIAQRLIDLIPLASRCLNSEEVSTMTVGLLQVSLQDIIKSAKDAKSAQRQVDSVGVLIKEIENHELSN